MIDRPDPNEGLVKVRVRLLGSALESGQELELLWAEPLGGGRYRIWSVPVFAYNLDMRDVVTCAPGPQGGLPIVTRVVEPGDCFTIRLYFSAEATDPQIQVVLDRLVEREALLEKGSRLLWAVGLRTRKDYDWGRLDLEPFVAEGSSPSSRPSNPISPRQGTPPDRRSLRTPPSNWRPSTITHLLRGHVEGKQIRATGILLAAASIWKLRLRGFRYRINDHEATQRRIQMSKVLSVLLLAVALGFVVGVATAVFRVAAAAEDGVLLIMGPFFGAFFAFLFVRIGDALKRVYERRVGHHSALVRIEHYLNDVMSVLHDNIFLATGFIETLRVPVESGAVRASSNRLSTVPLEREKLLDLLNLDLVNDLFTFHVELRKLNDSIGSQARLYDRALESLSGTHRDLEEYKGNTERAVQAMKMIFVGLRHAHKESIDLSAKVRVLARDMPFFVWIMHVFTPLHYKVGFERVWRQEVEKVQAEMRQSEQESGKRIDDMEEELRTMR